MRLTNGHAFCFCVGSFIGFVTGCVFGLQQNGPDIYRQAQIDALTGNVKYELVKQPNGETLWVEREAENEKP